MLGNKTTHDSKIRLSKTIIGFMWSFPKMDNLILMDWPKKNITTQCSFYCRKVEDKTVFILVSYPLPRSCFCILKSNLCCTHINSFNDESSKATHTHTHTRVIANDLTYLISLFLFFLSPISLGVSLSLLPARILAFPLYM